MYTFFLVVEYTYLSQPKEHMNHMLMFLHWHRYQILLQSKLLVTALIMWVMRGQRQTTLQWNVLGEHVWFEDREENH
jgi:hypothetical protein